MVVSKYDISDGDMTYLAPKGKYVFLQLGATVGVYAEFTTGVTYVMLSEKWSTLQPRSTSDLNVEALASQEEASYKSPTISFKIGSTLSNLFTITQLTKLTSYNQRLMQRRKSSLRATVQRQSTINENVYSDTSSRKLSCRDRLTLPTQKQANNISMELSAKKSSQSLIQTLKELQKKAAQEFYQKNYDDAFDTLRCCEEINAKLSSIEHRVYIHYLYIQFYCKLRQYSKSLHHYDIAKEIYIASSSTQQKRLRHYIVNIQCIHVSMLYEMKDYEEVIKSVVEVVEQLQKGSPQWIKCEGIRLKAYLNLQRLQESIALAQQLSKYASNQSEKYKYTLRIMECFLKLNQHQNAVSLLEFSLKQCDKERESDILNKLTEICMQTGDTIKSIYYLQKLREHDYYQIDSLKLLSTLYFDVGDWPQLQSTLTSLNNLTDLTYEELHLLAQSRHYQGNTQQAISIYNQIVQESHQRIEKLKAYLQLSKLSEESRLYQPSVVKECNFLKSQESYSILKQYIGILLQQGEYQRAEHLYETTLNQPILQKYPNLLYEFLKDFGEMLEWLDRKNQSQVCFNRANKVRRTSIRYE